MDLGGEVEPGCRGSGTGVKGRMHWLSLSLSIEAGPIDESQDEKKNIQGYEALTLTGGFEALSLMILSLRRCSLSSFFNPSNSFNVLPRSWIFVPSFNPTFSSVVLRASSSDFQNNFLPL